VAILRATLPELVQERLAELDVASLEIDAEARVQRRPR